MIFISFRIIVLEVASVYVHTLHRGWIEYEVCYSSSTHEKNEEVNVETEKEHYRKRLNFRGPKTHENRPKPTKIQYFRRQADENSRRK